MYGTFVEYTNLVGALGFGPTVALLATQRLVCIDEFDSTTPATRCSSPRCSPASPRPGCSWPRPRTRCPASSARAASPPPTSCARSRAFRALHRGAHRRPRLPAAGRGRRARTARPRGRAKASERGAAADRYLDDFDELVKHLSSLHPSRYGALLDGVARCGLIGLRPVEDQNAALRLVVFVDRLYDRSIPGWPRAWRRTSCSRPNCWPRVCTGRSTCAPSVG